MITCAITEDEGGSRGGVAGVSDVTRPVEPSGAASMRTAAESRASAALGCLLAVARSPPSRRCTYE